MLRLNELNKTYTLALYCLTDIGINYEGWTFEDTQEFLGVDEETCREVYEMMVEELRDKAEETLGDKFDLKEFHTFLLDIGPAQFEIIEERMEEWMKEL